MDLIQLFLPVRTDSGDTFPKSLYDDLAEHLTEIFGGVTAYTRSPAKGLWEDSGETVRDEMVIYEVMVEQVDAPWWAKLRKDLELAFEQEELVIRALPMRRL